MSLRARLRCTKMARSCENFAVCTVAHTPNSEASFFTSITLVTSPHERLMLKRVISPASCCVPERRGWACCLAQQPSTRRRRPPQCTTACQTHADFLPAHRGPQCRPATQSPASAWNPACNHNTRAKVLKETEKKTQLGRKTLKICKCFHLHASYGCSINIFFSQIWVPQGAVMLVRSLPKKSRKRLPCDIWYFGHMCQPSLR